MAPKLFCSNCEHYGKMVRDVSMVRLVVDASGKTFVGELPITKYNDDYPTCERTYATLRIYAAELSPGGITSLLGVDPTESQPAQARSAGIRDIPAGWFLSTDGIVDSRDVRRHIDWILNQIADADEGLSTIREAGGRADISCYWVSATGHGGPSVLPQQMAKLGSMGLELWFDVYLGSDSPVG